MTEPTISMEPTVSKQEEMYMEQKQYELTNEFPTHANAAVQWGLKLSSETFHKIISNSAFMEVEAYVNDVTRLVQWPTQIFNKRLTLDQERDIRCKMISTAQENGFNVIDLAKTLCARANLYNQAEAINWEVYAYAGALFMDESADGN